MITIELPIVPLIIAGAMCLFWDFAVASDDDIVGVMLFKYLFCIVLFFAVFGACIMWGAM